MVFDIMNWKEENIASQFFAQKVSSFQNASDEQKKKQIACAKERRTLALYFFHTARAEREKRRREERERYVRGSDDASAEAKNGSERLVGRDCEQRRYLFQIHFAEIESN